MNESQQPEAVWVFPPEKPRSGRVWLIVLLSIAAIAIVAVLLFLFLPRGVEPDPTASETPHATSTATVAPSPSPTEPTSTPAPTRSPTIDPEVTAFAAEVQPVLDDAVTGLSLAEGAGGQDAAQIVDSLIDDAGRLSERAAPASIADDWSAQVSEYTHELERLRSAYAGGSSATQELAGARASLTSLRALVGL